MGKRGPAPGSGKSGGAERGRRGGAARGKGAAPIIAALDRLEESIRAAALRLDIKYDEAQALFMRLDSLSGLMETTVVVAASGYPESGEPGDGGVR